MAVDTKVRNIVVLCLNEHIARTVVEECREREIEATWVRDTNWRPEPGKFYIWFVPRKEANVWETWLLRHFRGSSILNWF